ncbi:hormogonium polysaccharide biosynthesis glycosyltransferase HpsE, partial [Limnofasciculus baicalensis]
DFTVAIPTYNGENRLPEVLDRLRNQVGTESIQWEIIVIDNNSTDNTAKVVRKYQSDWPSEYPLRYYFEPQQGAGFARKRAVDKSEGTLIGFLDDDNIPSPTWVAAAYAFGQDYPQVGAYGGQIHGDFEVPPPQELSPLLAFLAIVERGLEPFRYEPRRKLMPPGAGLVVRKEAYLTSVPGKTILTGRIEGNTLTGEDLEMLCYIQQGGWEIWYNPAMEMDHKIPHLRLKREYLIPFIRGIGLSRFVTRMLSVKQWQRPLAYVAYTLNDVKKVILHVIKYKGKIKSNLLAECHTELFLSSLISPFYLWRNGYFNIGEEDVKLKDSLLRNSEKCL